MVAGTPGPQDLCPGDAAAAAGGGGPQAGPAAAMPNDAERHGN